MRGNVVGRYARIAHDRDAGTDFLIYAGALERMREGMVGSELMADLVHDVVDIEVITLRNAIGRRCDSAPFGVIGAANAADAAGIAAAARGPEHMADVIHGRCDTRILNRGRQLVVPAAYIGRIRVRLRIIKDDAGRLRYQVQVYAEVLLLHAVRTGQRGVKGCQDQCLVRGGTGG